MSYWSPIVVLAAVWVLLPLFLLGFGGKYVVTSLQRAPLLVRMVLPCTFGVPYFLISRSAGVFEPDWLICYCLVPVLIAVLLWHANQNDASKKGNWRDFAILSVIGLAVDLRWLEPAWPAHLGVFGKMIMLDAGLYGFMVIRELDCVGFDLRIKKADLLTGLRELAYYTPFALILGLVLGFLHPRPHIPHPGSALLGWVFTFVLIAIPEEVYFRGWIQNLLERRIGRTSAIGMTSILFGLAHFNKRSAHFNWKYVLLATVAGIFYGRAWRRDRRVVASAITHASVDTIWSIWF